MSIKKFVDNYAIFILVAGFALVYTVLPIVRHNHFGSFAFDLGIYDQVIWLYSRLKPPFSTIEFITYQKHLIILGDHFTPTLAFLAPLYWIWDNVRILFIAQALLLASSGYAFYLISQKILQNKFISLVISFSYLAFFGIQNAVAFDFHEITLAAALFPWAIYSLLQKKWLWYFVFLVLVLGLKENLSLSLTLFGFYIFLVFKERKIGVLTSLISLAWFILAVFIFVPFFRQSGYPYFPSGTSDIPIWQAMFWPPVKLQTIFWTFFSFGFLPVLNPAILPIIFEQFSERFLDNAHHSYWTTGFQYSVWLGPFLTLAAIRGMENFKKLRLKVFNREILIIILFGSVMITQYFLHPPLNTLFKKNFWRNEQWMEDNRKVIKRIPMGAKVAAQNNLVPHLTHRENIFIFPDIIPEITNVEYIFLDLRPGQPQNNFWPISYEKAKQEIGLLMEHKKFEIIYQKGDAVLLQRIKK